jgi:hypothetical protein
MIANLYAALSIDNDVTCNAQPAIGKFRMYRSSKPPKISDESATSPRGADVRIRRALTACPEIEPV